VHTEQSVRDFAAALASGEPVPGGGAAGALAGALAAALAAMVCQFTVGRRRFEAVEAEMRALLARADQIRGEMVELVEADARAYQSVVEAQALPKETPVEAETRQRRMQEAVASAIRVPLRSAVLAADVLALCEPIAERGNPRLVSDAGVAAILADAALHASALNVRANYPTLREAGVRDESEAVLARLFGAANELRPRVLALVEKKLG
jgi:glutamate formiminotransferase/formiminotetrahydrofolate cyclodeaminase